ncbi:hypothetical protein C8R47DRAFT_1209581 [Mycena vitilis]|nr:hypothetical protein C8R47DRAFT_1209581 [Mycena vitilis]
MAPQHWVNDTQRDFLMAQMLPYANAHLRHSLAPFWAHLAECWFDRWPEINQFADNLTEAQLFVLEQDVQSTMKRVQMFVRNAAHRQQQLGIA